MASRDRGRGRKHSSRSEKKKT